MGIYKPQLLLILLLSAAINTIFFLNFDLEHQHCEVLMPDWLQMVSH